MDDLMCLLPRPVETARLIGVMPEKAELPNAENRKPDRLLRHGEALQNGTPANLGS